MRKLILTGIAGLTLAAPATAGLMAAAPAAAAPAQLIVAMRDPGCHWFYVGGGPDSRAYSLTAVRHGSVPLVNLDQAALVIKGPGGTKIDPVGAKLMLKAKGLYRITMVKQAKDDNHLKLTIK
jgi:hypothetical protein